MPLCFFVLLKPAAAAYSTSFDFGSVGLGTTSITTVTIYNKESIAVEVTGIAFLSDGCLDFTVINQNKFDLVPAGGKLEIDVAYAPSVTGDCSNVLRIWTNSPIPITVAFNGTGVVNQAILIHKIQEIHAYMDAMMVGNGPGKSAHNRLHTIREMVKTAALQIENGQTQAAYHKLSSIYKKADGLPKPVDFIASDSTQGRHSTVGLAELIKDLMAFLQAELKKNAKRVEYKPSR
ncbi:MAG: hypothetical protein PVH43_15500 [Desulfobacterales bacterium]